MFYLCDKQLMRGPIICRSSMTVFRTGRAYTYQKYYAKLAADLQNKVFNKSKKKKVIIRAQYFASWPSNHIVDRFPYVIF